MGKGVTEMRSSQRKQVPDTVGPGKHMQTLLGRIADKARVNKFAPAHEQLQLFSC